MEIKIHGIIIILCDANGLNWLCNQIFYHRFTNLGELIQLYLMSKFRKGLAQVKKNRECKWKSTTRVNSICKYGSKCKKATLFTK